MTVMERSTMNITESAPSAKPRHRDIIFACLPYEICESMRNHDLTPFELAVMGTVISMARLAHVENMHLETFHTDGKTGIEAELELHRQHGEDWEHVHRMNRDGFSIPTPKRYHDFDINRPRVKPIKLGKSIKLSGSRRYNDGMARRRTEPKPDVISFETSRYELLNAARLSQATKNRRSLDDALATLSKPIRLGRRKCYRLLTVEVLPTGRMILHVKGGWLEPQYARVPLPFPTRSVAALGLLLLFRMTYRDQKEHQSETLRKNLRIEGTAWHCTRALHRAVDILNHSYLPALERDALRNSVRKEIKMPPAFELKRIEDGSKVSIVGVDNAAPPMPKPKRKRIRVVKRKRERVRIEPTPVSYHGTPEFGRYLKSRGVGRFDETDLDPASRAELAGYHADYVKLMDEEHDAFIAKRGVANKWGRLKAH
jgi:hypothetical protein